MDQTQGPADLHLPGRGRQVAAVAVAVLLLAGALGVYRLVVPPGEGEPAARAVAAVADPAPPTRLEVPSLDIRAPVVPIEMNRAGVLTPPGDVDTVGWWQRSAQPGAREGRILVTGHTVRIGDGALDEIGSLEAGDEVVLRSEGTATRFRTTEVFTYSRPEVAKNAVELFGQDQGAGELVLVTCTDWDGKGWASNIIVLAEPVRRT